MQQKLFTCQYCTFTSKTETEIKNHNQKYDITHSNLDYNAHLEKLNYKIFALKEIGLWKEPQISLCFAFGSIHL